jgi:hypothetical protein
VPPAGGPFQNRSTSGADPSAHAEGNQAHGGNAMKFPRRHLLRVAATTAALSMTCIAFALEYPTRAVHIIVGFAAGH